MPSSLKMVGGIAWHYVDEQLIVLYVSRDYFKVLEPRGFEEIVSIRGTLNPHIYRGCRK